VIFALPRLAQRQHFVITWEVETQPLRLILFERDKESIGGGDCYFSEVLEEDFAGVLADSVLQQL